MDVFLDVKGKLGWLLPPWGHSALLNEGRFGLAFGSFLRNISYSIGLSPTIIIIIIIINKAFHSVNRCEELTRFHHTGLLIVF